MPGAISRTPEYRKLYDKLVRKLIPDADLLNDFAKAHGILPSKLQDMLDEVRGMEQVSTKKRKLKDITSEEEVMSEAGKGAEQSAEVTKNLAESPKAKTELENQLFTIGSQSAEVTKDLAESPKAKTELENQLFTIGSQSITIGTSLLHELTYITQYLYQHVPWISDPTILHSCEKIRSGGYAALLREMQGFFTSEEVHQSIILDPVRSLEHRSELLQECQELYEDWKQRYVIPTPQNIPLYGKWFRQGDLHVLAVNDEELDYFMKYRLSREPPETAQSDSPGPPEKDQEAHGNTSETLTNSPEDSQENHGEIALLKASIQDPKKDVSIKHSDALDGLMVEELQGWRDHRVALQEVRDMGLVYPLSPEALSVAWNRKATPASAFGSVMQRQDPISTIDLTPSSQAPNYIVPHIGSAPQTSAASSTLPLQSNSPPLPLQHSSSGFTALQMNQPPDPYHLHPPPPTPNDQYSTPPVILNQTATPNLLGGAQAYPPYPYQPGNHSDPNQYEAFLRFMSSFQQYGPNMGWDMRGRGRGL